MKTIHWGILGCGVIARKFIEALKSVEHADLLAVASTSSEKARQYAEEYQVPNYYTNYLDLVSNPDLDAVYIANSHNFHKESALLCMNHGKAVLCEKPLTVNAIEAGELIEASRTKHVFLMEAMWTRFLPAIRKVKEMLEQKAIGEVQLVTGSFGYKSNVGPENRLLNRTLAGGALLDVGIYPITLASLVYGKPPVMMRSSARIGSTGVDEASSYLLTYENGATALLNASISYQTHKTAVITGTKGLIQIPTFWKAEKITVEIENQETVTFDFPFRYNGFEYEIEEVNACIRAGITESSIMPLSESLMIMQTMDQLRSQWNMVYPGE